MAGYLLLVLTPLAIPFVWIIAALLWPGIHFGLERFGSATRIAFVMTAVSVLLSALLVDTFWDARSQLAASNDPRDREGDRQLWQGEVSPRRFYPTPLDFSLYKPNVSTRALQHGEAYNIDGPLLLRSDAARRALRRMWVDYRIDEHGFRQTGPMESARVFTLGDSYTFGDHMQGDAVWHQVLARETGQAIYNIGVTNTSPAQQLALLEYLFSNHGDLFRPRHILWMLFEANDLEDRYTRYRQGKARPGLYAVLASHAMAEILLDMPQATRRSSIVYQLLYGTRSIRGFSDSVIADQFIDGIPLRTRVYHSERYGPRIVPYPRYVERATQAEDYVRNHANAPEFRAVLQRVRELSQQRNFSVTIILAPSAPRVYGRFYKDMPTPSDHAHVLQFFEDTALEIGYPVINLLPVFEARANEELLYHSDDSHWNRRGHALVGRHLAQHWRVEN